MLKNSIDHTAQESAILLLQMSHLEMENNIVNLWHFQFFKLWFYQKHEFSNKYSWRHGSQFNLLLQIKLKISNLIMRILPVEKTVEKTVEKMRWSKGQQARSHISLGCENKPSHNSSDPPDEKRSKWTLKSTNQNLPIQTKQIQRKKKEKSIEWSITSFSSFKLNVPVRKLVWSLSAFTSDIHLA